MALPSTDFFEPVEEPSFLFAESEERRASTSSAKSDLGEKPGLTRAHLALFRELLDLKRVHSADRTESIAERLFAAGWSALLGTDDPHHTMLRTVAAALAAARLGDLDLAKLTTLGLDDDEAIAVLERAFDEVAGPIDPVLAADLRAALGQGARSRRPAPLRPPAGGAAPRG